MNKNRYLIIFVRTIKKPDFVYNYNSTEIDSFCLDLDSVKKRMKRWRAEWFDNQVLWPIIIDLQKQCVVDDPWEYKEEE